MQDGGGQRHGGAVGVSGRAGRLEIPLVIFLALVALGLPAFACMNFMAGDRFFTTTALFFAQQYCWDCYEGRRVKAVAFPNPLVGSGHVHRVLVLRVLVCWLLDTGKRYHLAAHTGLPLRAFRSEMCARA